MTSISASCLGLFSRPCAQCQKSTIGSDLIYHQMCLSCGNFFCPRHAPAAGAPCQKCS